MRFPFLICTDRALTVRGEYLNMIQKITKVFLELLSALQQLHNSQTTSRLAVDLPPTNALTTPFSTSPQSIAQKRIPQCHVSETLHASRLALVLIEIIIGATQSQSGFAVPRPVCRNLRSWAAGGCSRFWQTSSRWPLWSGSRESAQNLTESYLRVLRFAIAGPTALREATVLVQAVSDLLSQRSENRPDRKLQREIAKCILGIWELSLTTHVVKQLAIDQFTPTFLILQSSDILSSGLLPELKVCKKSVPLENKS